MCTGYSLKQIEDVEINDGEETPLDIILDPLDSDNDGIPDPVELASSCLNADDGWLDGEEDSNNNGKADPGEKDPNQYNAPCLPLLPLLLS